MEWITTHSRNIIDHAMAMRNLVREEILSLFSTLNQTERLSLLEALRSQSAADRRPMSHEEFLQQIGPAFGLWANRADLPEDSNEFVRKLRSEWDDRLTRVEGTTKDKDVRT